MKVERFLQKVAVLPTDDAILRERIGYQRSEERIAKGDDSSFFVATLDDIIKKYDTWKQVLPRIQPFYAVKCNDNSAVIHTLARIGCNFDCASKIEIQQVLSHGIPPDRIIYANPTKQISHIQYAAAAGVSLMTIDNEDELLKVADLFPSARLVIRIAPPSIGEVQIDLSEKFGCSKAEVKKLLKKASSLGLTVVGISFHVGSGIRDPSSLPRTIKYVSTIFNEADSNGFKLSLLDVGGGFPGHRADYALFKEMAARLHDSLNNYFPPSMNVQIIAEPGRYFVTSALELYTFVIGSEPFFDKKSETNKELYILSEGFFGCFNGIITEDSPILPKVLKTGEPSQCILLGPSTHNHDVIKYNAVLPKLDISDVVVFTDCGAYSGVISMTFPIPEIYWFISTSNIRRLTECSVDPAIMLPSEKLKPSPCHKGKVLLDTNHNIKATSSCV